VSFVQALAWNVGTCRCDAKREAQVEGLHECESSEAQHRGGAACNSDEVPVMGMERRGCPIWRALMDQLVTG
jgi:hypothetical protein